MITPSYSRLLLALLNITFTLAVYSQPSTEWFRRLSVEEGLSSTYVTSIIQDSRGFIWIGTWKGLNRYDGYEFKVFSHDPDDSLSIKDGVVYAILEGKEGDIWAGTGEGLSRLSLDTEEFYHYGAEVEDTTRSSPNGIYAMCESQSGELYLGARYGFYRFDRKKEKIIPFADGAAPQSLTKNVITSMCLGSEGEIWIGTYGDGLKRFHPESNQIDHFYENPGNPKSVHDDRILDIKRGMDGLIYIGTRSGLGLFDPKKETFSSRHPQKRIYAILEDQNDGSLWLGTPSGLFHEFRDTSQAPKRYVHHAAVPDGLSSSSINTLLQDREGSIWIGTNNGINLLTPEAFQFQHYKHHPEDSNSISQNNLHAVYESSNQMIWIGTKGAGLNRLDPKSGDIKRFPYGNGNSPYATSGKHIFSIGEDREGNIWVGSRSAGLSRLGHQSGTFSHQQWQGGRNLVSFFYEDKQGTFWVGHYGGISRYDRANKTFTYTTYAPEETGGRGRGVTTGILQDHTGTYWVSSNVFFLNQFDPNTGAFYRFRPDPDDPGSIRSDNIQSIYEDRKGQLWVGTSKGLDLYVREKESFRHFGLDDGLPHLMMGQMLEDGGGKLWMATGKGITRYDPASGSFRNYDQEDGLTSNESWDFAKGPTGRFSLSTVNGLTVFHPDSLQDNDIPPKIAFTSMLRYDKTSGREVEVKGISQKKAITLNYKDNIISFEFAAISFRKPSKNQYAYKLEGFTDQWIELGNRREATFTNLDPGDYVLRVIASNGDGLWNEEGASLNLTILPPWYWAWWSKTIYLLGFLLALFFLYRFLLNRRLQLAETHRLRELDRAKTKLYTNITHEFRTPLTVISGMADEVLNNPENWFREGLQMIKRNSNHLLRLVNQMLDLRKLESGSLPASMVQGDIITYLNYLLESFHSYAASKHIQLKMETETEKLIMDYDPEKFTAIVSNLLSNAIKFTAQGGSVRLTVSREQPVEHSGQADVNEPGRPDAACLLLRVADTGIGIPSESLPFIFDRFYQIPPEDEEPGHSSPRSGGREGTGTGIGLTLASELVKLLEGKIEVESETGRGTTFSVWLPIRRTAPLVEEAPIAPPFMEAFTPEQETEFFPPTDAHETEKRPLVLLVEDNKDVATFVGTCLQGKYELQIAYDGREGIEKALELAPDLIISDIMMPEKDGYELTQTVKNDSRTSHIPIILLTAKADIDSKLLGLEKGADAYLPKPFNRAELLLRIHKLLELREKLQAYYRSLAGGQTVDPAALSLEKPENAFVLKARSTIEDRLDDPDFSVDHLCRELAMSRSHAHRKLKALTGYSPNRFIRYVRLSKAKPLLLQPEYNVAEVAYLTGFADPSYFARVFRKEFGMTPSEFLERKEME